MRQMVSDPLLFGCRSLPKKQAILSRSGTSSVPATNSVNSPLREAVEIIKDCLYYNALKSPPSSTQRHEVITTAGEKKRIHYFCVDDELVYWNFFKDFGPLSLGSLYRFCSKLNHMLTTTKSVICFYSSAAASKRANAIFLICAWQVLYLNRTPEEAYRGFMPTDAVISSKRTTTRGNDDEDEDLLYRDVHIIRDEESSSVSSNCSSRPLVANSLTVAKLPPFHDASPCVCTYDLTVLDCLRGLAKARMYGFFDFDTFSVEEYEHFEQVENGDLNWIIQDKIMAFAGPSYKRQVSPEGYCTLSPSEYIPYFKKKNVGLVIRLNKKAYDEKQFIEAGISHFEQYYLDGSCPPLSKLQSILEAMEAVPQGSAVAIHCKAGLGRTGTCIGAYLMKHYKFSASEAIGWMRICRPGCVIGPQQHFLQDIEQLMWQEGSKLPDPELFLVSCSSSSSENNEVLKAAAAVVETNERPSSTYVSLSSTQRIHPNDAILGRAGQADALLAARRNHSILPDAKVMTRGFASLSSLAAETKDFFSSSSPESPHPITPDAKASGRSLSSTSRLMMHS